MLGKIKSMSAFVRTYLTGGKRKKMNRLKLNRQIYKLSYKHVNLNTLEVSSNTQTLAAASPTISSFRTALTAVSPRMALSVDSAININRP